MKRHSARPFWFSFVFLFSYPYLHPFFSRDYGLLIRLPAIELNKPHLSLAPLIASCTSELKTLDSRVLRSSLDSVLAQSESVFPRNILAPFHCNYYQLKIDPEASPYLGI